MICTRCTLDAPKRHLVSAECIVFLLEKISLAQKPVDVLPFQERIDQLVARNKELQAQLGKNRAGPEHETCIAHQFALNEHINELERENMILGGKNLELEEKIIKRGKRIASAQEQGLLRIAAAQLGAKRRNIK